MSGQARQVLYQSAARLHATAGTASDYTLELRNGDLSYAIPDFGRVPMAWQTFAAKQDREPVQLGTYPWQDPPEEGWTRGHVLYRRRFFLPTWDWNAVDDLDAAWDELAAVVREAEQDLNARNLVLLNSRAWLTWETAESGLFAWCPKETDGTGAREASSRPAPVMIKGHEQAEHVAAEWMRWLRYDDAAVTQATRDGGIDVQASQAVAQVKMLAKPVPAKDVQQLAGIARVGNVDALFFSLSGYTPDAVSWAERAAVALFSFSYDGDVHPVNDLARGLFQRR